jgi:hypothetical protein
VDRDQAVDEKHTEHPGRDFGFGKAAAAADGQDDRDWRGNREQPADKAVGGIGEAEVAPHPAQARARRGRLFQRQIHVAAPRRPARLEIDPIISDPGWVLRWTVYLIYREQDSGGCCSGKLPHLNGL